MTDLSTFDVVAKAEKGFKLYFKNPYDLSVELPIFMIVKGADSKTYKKALRAKKIETINNASINPKEKTTEDLENIERDNIELIAKLVVGLGETEGKKDTDYILDDNKQYKAVKKDIIHLLTKFPWMVDQVTIAIATRTNFLD